MTLEGTVNSLRDSLDNYGGNKTVCIEDLKGDLREVIEVYTRNLSGEVIVVIVIGDLYEQ